MTSALPEYQYGGARALVLLHEIHLRRFLVTWKRARSADLDLPRTEDESCATLSAMLFHVCAAARGYMVWACEVLKLPAPDLPAPPEADRIEGEVDEYVDRLLAGWRTPLAGVDENRFYRPEYPSRWKVLYCVDAMLEHAVMHPVRHEFQLRALLDRR